MKSLRLIGILVLVAIIGAGLVVYWEYERLYPSTDDARIAANVITISPQVGGPVVEVLVSENQRVTQGEILFSIDPAPYEAALSEARANLQTAIQSSGASDAQVSVANASINQAQAALNDAESELARQRQLFDRGDIAQAALDQAQSNRDQAAAQLASAQANAQAALATRGPTDADPAAVQAAQAKVNLAQLDLDHTLVRAPATGFISNLTLRPGAVVGADQSLFSLVDDSRWWVDANFKETDLSRIRPGQPVNVSIDMYPNVNLKGTVETLSAGSGSSFSLLPAQNASGNYVKIVQRFPVRIALEERPADPVHQLRVGASVEASVDTTDGERGIIERIVGLF
ncbi:HlyD family secretion protein [Fulvimarina endophytica]|uniref:HlyD family secretion protein n=1 Tax=Fulvimarina endophytica TaxID=2293836 RepID=A0A371X1C4_9HYPH|nr:HlyD family secretion protein [Fulvimarina endophytica]RFC63025.1 HlyD family secretion protein [Fulvimarina endophytica]